MIPQAFITEWSNYVPWQTNEQVEQDLIICRALIEIFSDEFLAKSLAFRGGTALHKLYLSPQPRYSEDIDLVQITAEPFGPVVDRIRERLAFLGEPVRKQKENNFTLHYRFESEFPPVQKLRLKVETNCREHFTVLGFQQFPFQVTSSWFNGFCLITTYKLEELLGTKLRALFQRRKGRDLYDIYTALIQSPNIDRHSILACYHTYMKFVVLEPPKLSVYLQNMEAKMRDDEFTGDIVALIRPTEKYDPLIAYQLIKEELLRKMDD
jgi:predicted nucleotidyltransferase component of viral defense system